LSLHICTAPHILIFELQYRATDTVIPGAGKLELVYTPDAGGEQKRLEVFQFDGPGVGLAMYNTTKVRTVEYARCGV
jgi:isocitrate dehydrogenase